MLAAYIAFVPFYITELLQALDLQSVSMAFFCAFFVVLDFSNDGFLSATI